MPYTTQLPDGVITLDTEGLPVVTTNFNSILNLLDPSDEFTNYDVSGDQGTTTLENGDTFALRYVDGGTGDITTVGGGTYLGDFTLSTASITVSLLGNDVTVTLNPIEGELYQDENGDFFMITDEPLDEDHIGLTIEVDPLLGPTLSIDLNLSDPLDDVPLVGDLVAPTVQQVLDTAIVTFDVDTSGTVTFEDELIPCFLRGTCIATDRGSIPVEELKVGDRVITRDNGYQEIRWIGSAKVSNSTLCQDDKLRPIRIRAGALGGNVPSEDLLVSPQHRVLLKNKLSYRMFKQSEVLIAAKKLVAIEGVERADDCRDVEYFHILLDSHQVIYSNSAPTETLYLGQQALEALGEEAREEIFALFPEFRCPGRFPEPARMILSGKKLKRFIYRQTKNHIPALVEV